MMEPGTSRKPSRQILLWAALALSLIGNAYQAYRLQQVDQAGQARRNDRAARIGHRADIYTELPMDSTSIVLFGDSHFEYFPAAEMLDLPNIKNRGISGQTVQDLIARSAEIVEAEPRTIVLCIGINDINRGRSLNDVARDVEQLIDLLHDGSPHTKLLVLSLPPNGHPTSQAKLVEHNAWLRKACARRGIEFLDITTPLTRDGLLDPGCTYDGLHLNAKGYRILAALLRTHL
ncbi:MAG: hypothetical protein JNL43_04410 [Flavobacteriales bacterium]|nr:hypothetical protein [Flavobacteriales bacterium]